MKSETPVAQDMRILKSSLVTPTLPSTVHTCMPLALVIVISPLQMLGSRTCLCPIPSTQSSAIESYPSNPPSLSSLQTSRQARHPPLAPACALSIAPTFLARYVHILLHAIPHCHPPNIPVLLEALRCPSHTALCPAVCLSAPPPLPPAHLFTYLALSPPHTICRM